MTCFFARASPYTFIEFLKRVAAKFGRVAIIAGQYSARYSRAVRKFIKKNEEDALTGPGWCAFPWAARSSTWPSSAGGGSRGRWASASTTPPLNDLRRAASKSMRTARFNLALEDSLRAKPPPDLLMHPRGRRRRGSPRGAAERACAASALRTAAAAASTKRSRHGAACMSSFPPPMPPFAAARKIGRVAGRPALPRPGRPGAPGAQRLCRFRVLRRRGRYGQSRRPLSARLNVTAFLGFAIACCCASSPSPRRPPRPCAAAARKGSGVPGQGGACRPAGRTRTRRRMHFCARRRRGRAARKGIDAPWLQGPAGAALPAPGRHRAAARPAEHSQRRGG